MQGWSTGPRSRHTLAGVPTRPIVKRGHARADMLMKAKKPQPSLYGRGCCALVTGRPSPDHAYGRDERIILYLLLATSCSIEAQPTAIRSKMENVPIIKNFELIGLHGYKNISIDCSSTASIFIAENGVGKTTVLNALYAILTKKFNILSTINFKLAVLTFTDGSNVEIEKDRLFSNINKVKKLLISDNQFIDIKPYARIDSIINLINKSSIFGIDKITNDGTYQHIYQSSPYSHTQLKEKIQSLSSKIGSKEYIENISKIISNAIGNSSVLYLPTYRRIEAAFDDMPFSKKTNRGFNFDEHGMPDFDEYDDETDNEENDQLINFGLSDVESKLKQMSETVQQTLLEEYSKISGNMLDLMLGMTKLQLPNEVPVDLERVNIMLSRLGKESISQDDLKNSLIDSKATEESKLLTYFLRQLLSTQDKFSIQEASIESFTKIINSYLKESKTDIELIFDKAHFRVDIWHKTLKEKLSWSNLSSGEKQIVSIFSKLILGDYKKTIILIDEPELSLSIEWQKKFLPDILETDRCSQLLAITHSPFVFDNCLDPFAKTINIKVEEK